jgi:hypothetical protein
MANCLGILRCRLHLRMGFVDLGCQLAGQEEQEETQMMLDRLIAFGILIGVWCLVLGYLVLR